MGVAPGWHVTAPAGRRIWLVPDRVGWLRIHIRGAALPLTPGYEPKALSAFELATTVPCHGGDLRFIHSGPPIPPTDDPPQMTSGANGDRRTSMNANLVRAALRQQLETDRMFGITSVPVRLPAPAAPRSPGSKQSGASKPRDGERAPATSAVPTSYSAPRLRTDASGNAARLRLLDDGQVKGCRKCGLSASRTQTVFGQGNPAPRLVFVGEGPGYEEDKQGLAFVGPAGQLLTRMIVAMGVTRDEVYICNVVKCRPPGNRTPSADEMLACNPYLREQLQILQPEMIVALGAPAAKTLLNTTETIGRLRGRFHDYYISGVTGEGPVVPLMPTYHPAYLLRTPEEKGKSWADLQQVMARLGLQPPPKVKS